MNRELGEELVRKSPMFTRRTDAHAQEHSVEVEIPFLQHHLKKHLWIVPIVLGANRSETCRKIGEALLPFLNEKNLFVIARISHTIRGTTTRSPSTKQLPTRLSPILQRT
jgi:hypothetical protein